MVMSRPQSSADDTSCVTATARSTEPKGQVRSRFLGRVFYLHLPGCSAVVQRLQRDIIALGGEVDTFLSKDVDYVVTTASLVQQHAKPALSTPTNKIASKTPLVSRGKALLLLSRVSGRQDTSTTDVMSRVRLLRLKVIRLSDLESMIASVNHQIGLPATRHGIQIAASDLRGKVKVKVTRIQTPLIKIEDCSLAYKPIQQRFDSLPFWRADGSISGSPFEEATKKTTRRHDISDSDRQPARPRHTRRRMRSRAAVETKRDGFCECCDVYCDDIRAHLRSKNHRDFSLANEHFSQLDFTIALLPSLDAFSVSVVNSSTTLRTNDDIGNVAGGIADDGCCKRAKDLCEYSPSDIGQGQVGRNEFRLHAPTGSGATSQTPPTEHATIVNMPSNVRRKIPQDDDEDDAATMFAAMRDVSLDSRVARDLDVTSAALGGARARVTIGDREASAMQANGAASRSASASVAQAPTTLPRDHDACWGGSDAALVRGPDVVDHRTDTGSSAAGTHGTAAPCDDIAAKCDLRSAGVDSVTMSNGELMMSRNNGGPPYGHSVDQEHATGWPEINCLEMTLAAPRDNVEYETALALLPAQLEGLMTSLVTGRPHSRPSAVDDVSVRPYSPLSHTANGVNLRPYSQMSTANDVSVRPYSPLSTANDVSVRPYSPLSTANDVNVRPYSPLSTTNDVNVRPYSPLSTANDVNVRPYNSLLTANGVNVRPCIPLSTANDVNIRPYSPLSTANDVNTRPYSPLSTANDANVRPYSPLLTANDVNVRPDSLLSTANDVNVRPYSPLSTANDVNVRLYSLLSTANDVNVRPYTPLPTANDVIVRPYSPLSTANDMSVPPYSSSSAAADVNVCPRSPTLAIDSANAGSYMPLLTTDTVNVRPYSPPPTADDVNACLFSPSLTCDDVNVYFHSPSLIADDVGIPSYSLELREDDTNVHSHSPSLTTNGVNARPYGELRTADDMKSRPCSPLPTGGAVNARPCRPELATCDANVRAQSPLQTRDDVNDVALAALTNSLATGCGVNCKKDDCFDCTVNCVRSVMALTGSRPVNCVRSVGATTDPRTVNFVRSIVATTGWRPGNCVGPGITAAHLGTANDQRTEQCTPMNCLGKDKEPLEESMPNDPAQEQRVGAMPIRGVLASAALTTQLRTSDDSETTTSPPSLLDAVVRDIIQNSFLANTAPLPTGTEPRRGAVHDESRHRRRRQLAPSCTTNASPPKAVGRARLRVGRKHAPMLRRMLLSGTRRRAGSSSSVANGIVTRGNRRDSVSKSENGSVVDVDATDIGEQLKNAMRAADIFDDWVQFFDSCDLACLEDGEDAGSADELCKTFDLITTSENAPRIASAMVCGVSGEAADSPLDKGRNVCAVDGNHRDNATLKDASNTSAIEIGITCMDIRRKSATTPSRIKIAGGAPLQNGTAQFTCYVIDDLKVRLVKTPTAVKPLPSAVVTPHVAQLRRRTRRCKWIDHMVGSKNHRGNQRINSSSDSSSSSSNNNSSGSSSGGRSSEESDISQRDVNVVDIESPAEVVWSVAPSDGLGLKLRKLQLTPWRHAADRASKSQWSVRKLDGCKIKLSAQKVTPGIVHPNYAQRNDGFTLRSKPSKRRKLF